MKQIIAVLISAITIIGCSADTPDPRVDVTITLLSESVLSTQVFTPDLDLAVNSYSISGAGPGGTVFDFSTELSELVIEDQLPGMWIVEGRGFNADGDLLVSGSAEAVLDSNSSSIALTLTPQIGSGTVDITVTWDSTLVRSPTLIIKLDDSDGQPVNLEVETAAGTASASGAVDSGLFTLAVQLNENGTLIAGAADLVFVMPEHTTYVILPIEIHLTPVSPALTIEHDRLEPLDLRIAGYDPPLFTGTGANLRVMATDSPDPIDENLIWYADGEAAGAGPIMQFLPENPGTWRFDALFSGANLTSGGSASLTVSAYDPIYYGTLVFIESIFDNSDQNDGLSGVRSLAQVGSFLYTAGYSEDEIGIYEINPDTGKLAFAGVLNPSTLPEPGWLNGPSGMTNIPGTNLLGVVCSVSGTLLMLQSNSATGELALADALTPRADGFTAVPEDLLADTNPLLGAAALSYNPISSTLYAVSPALHTISSYLLNLETGTAFPQFLITPAALAAAGHDGSLLAGPEDVAIAPDGLLGAVTCKSSDSALLFDAAADGGLTYRQAFTDALDGVDGLNGAQNAAFSPDGENLYVSGYYDDGIAVFHFEQASDEWEYAGFQQEGEGFGLHYPRDLAVSPAGDELYVCAGGSDAFTVFSRSENEYLSNPVSAMNGEDRVIGLDGIRALAVSDDGKYVYAAASNDRTVSLFERL